jgi:hypothetical protein
MTRRRRFLGTAAAALAGVGGCLGGPGEGDDPAENTPESVDLSLSTVQRGVVKFTYPDAISVVETDRRFVAVTAAVATDDPPSHREFALRFDGEEYGVRVPDRRGQHYRLGPLYTDWSPGGQLLFALPPTGNADDAAVVTPEGEWPLPAAARNRMETAPSFAVTVESVGSEGAPGFAIEATNEGDRPQRFLAAVNQTGPMYAPVDAPTTVIDGGATATLKATVSTGPAAVLTTASDGEERTGRVSFDWVGGSAERSVPL